MNRADFLIESLDSIVAFMNDDIEIIVFDGSNNENELQKTSDYIQNKKNIVHVLSPHPTGIDEGYDLSVNYAKSKYCWLLPDDDPIFLDQVENMLVKLKDDYDLILVNLECWTKELNANLEQPLFTAEKDMEFNNNKGVSFWKNIGIPISYIGSIIVKREIWKEIDKKPFYGSYFAHAQVIMNSNKINKVFLLAKPIIQYRSGNSSWTARSFEIWNFLWPNLIWDNPHLNDEEKSAIVPKQPWRRKRSMIKSRAMGEYNKDIYFKFLKNKLTFWEKPAYLAISLIPAGPLNYLILIALVIFFKSRKYSIYNLAITNPHYQNIRLFLKNFNL